MINAVRNKVFQNRWMAAVSMIIAAITLGGTVSARVVSMLDNTPPSVTVDIANRCVSDTAGKIFLSLSDTETPAGQLIVTAISSDQAVIPDSAITVSFLGSTPGRFRALDVETQPRRPGVAIITVTVSDGLASTDFAVPVIVGTRGADSLLGTAQPEMIFGLGGDDSIDAGAGNDLLCAGKGRDTLIGGAGADSFDGSQGQDTVVDANPNEGDVDFGT